MVETIVDEDKEMKQTWMNEPITDFVKMMFDEPDMDDGLADAILWGCTGFPSFFHTNNRLKEMAYSLRHAKRSLKRGFSIEQIYVGDDTLNPNHRPILERMNG